MFNIFKLRLVDQAYVAKLEDDLRDMKGYLKEYGDYIEYDTDRIAELENKLKISQEYCSVLSDNYDRLLEKFSKRSKRK